MTTTSSEEMYRDLPDYLRDMMIKAEDFLRECGVQINVPIFRSFNAKENDVEVFEELSGGLALTARSITTSYTRAKLKTMYPFIKPGTKKVIGFKLPEGLCIATLLDLAQSLKEGKLQSGKFYLALSTKYQDWYSYHLGHREWCTICFGLREFGANNQPQFGTGVWGVYTDAYGGQYDDNGRIVIGLV